MFRTTGAVAVLAAAALTAHAHFVFVVPDAKDPSKVVVVFSEDLDPDENVAAEKMAGLKLTCRDAAGKDVAVGHKVGKHELTATLPGSGPRVVYGTLHYGVLQKGGAKPYLLAYHPKAIVGGVPADKAAVGEKAVPVELIPVVSGSEVKFKFLAGGKPVADAEVTVIQPEGGKAKAKTDKDGLTRAFPAKGRYGAWARHTDPRPGEHSGKKYDEARHYATLVVDLPAR